MPISISTPSGTQVGLTAGPVLDSSHERVLDYTRGIFGSVAMLARELDPETGEECFVVTATATGDVDQIVAANDCWHRGLVDVAGGSAPQYRLSLDPQ